MSRLLGHAKRVKQYIRNIPATGVQYMPSYVILSSRSKSIGLTGAYGFFFSYYHFYDQSNEVGEFYVLMLNVLLLGFRV